MMKRTDKEKSFRSESTSVLRILGVSQTGDHSAIANAKSLRVVPSDIRKTEALKRLYLDRYE